jgi:hypothetical protein
VTALVNPYMSFPASAATLSFVGSARNVASSSSTVNVTLPAGSAAGDLCLAVAIGKAGDTSAPSGFTPVSGANPLTGPGSSSALRAGTKALTSGDISSGFVTMPGDPGFNGIEYVIDVWHSTAGTPTVDATSTGSGNPFTTDTVCVIPSVTTTVDGAIVAVFTGGRTPGTSWSSLPAGNIHDQQRVGSFVSIYAGHFTQASAGATGTQNATNTGATNKEYVSLAVAVKP